MLSLHVWAKAGKLTVSPQSRKRIAPSLGQDQVKLSFLMIPGIPSFGSIRPANCSFAFNPADAAGFS